jgi:hypothetical protein
VEQGGKRKREPNPTLDGTVSVSLEQGGKGRMGTLAYTGVNSKLFVEQGGKRNGEPYPTLDGTVSVSLEQGGNGRMGI